MDTPCGRMMSDVSSMFIHYLLEFLRWNDDVELVNEMWPYAKRAAQWQISVSSKYGVPEKLQSTYDILGLNSYEYAAYNSAFHLLAMAGAEKLARFMGDSEFAETCAAAFSRAQAAIDALSWDEQGGFYASYTNSSALMSDTFYAQVLAYTTGLGDLLADPTKLDKHNAAVLKSNDTPYGFIIQTGRYPYPGPAQDNSLWQMASPNWAALMLHRGAAVDGSLSQPAKSLGLWRSQLNDLWNVAGVAGGIDLPQFGLPWITSHYGYAMSSWHILFALSGQNATLPSLTFAPRMEAPYSLPVLLPGVVGSVADDGAGQLTLSLTVGSLSLTHLAVGSAVYPAPKVSVTPTAPATWSASAATRSNEASSAT